MENNEKVLYKKQWKKKYLKQLCGFANSNGGCIYIEDASVKDPAMTVAIQAEEIGKKIEKELGIAAMISETEVSGVRCLEIGVAPSLRPIAYGGSYYADGPKGNQRLEGEPLVQMISAKFDALSKMLADEAKTQKKQSVTKKKPEKKEIEVPVKEATENTVREMSQKSRADGTEEKLLEMFREDPYMKQEMAAERLGISLRTVKRIVRALTDANRLVRAGGRRYGHWEFPDEA